MEWPDRGVTVLAGTSGSGKSTLALALCGLKPVKKGFEWIHKGKNLALLSPPKRNISLLFQSLELFPHLTAEQNILFSARAYKMSKGEIKKKWDLLETHLQLSSFVKKSVSVLSGGEKQRTALARALIVRPDFLILDEPFSSLDEERKREFILLLGKIQQSEPTPVLLISHEYTKTLAQHIFYLQNGQIKERAK